jgi:hypothetical protein
MNKRIKVAVSVAIAIKSIIFIFFAYQFTKYYPSKNIINNIFIVAGDTYSYFPPIEALIDGNGYSFKTETDGKLRYLPYAERMPGLIPLYGPMYYFFGSNTGRFLFILTQFCLSTIALILLAYLAFELFHSWPIFYGVLFIYTFSTFIWILDHWGLSDSLAISFSTISIYFFVRALRIQEKGNLLPALRRKVNFLILFSGILMCWATFIRPVYGIFFAWLILSYLYLFFPRNKYQLIVSFYHLLLYITPLIICLSLWTARNYAKFNKIIPLQVPYEDTFGKHTYLLRHEVITMAGNEVQPWAQGSVGQWFYPYFIENKYHYPKNPITQHPFTNKDFTPDFNIDSLIKLRERYHNSFRSDYSGQKRKEFEKLTINSAKFYIASYKKNHPFRYYIFTPAEITLKFFFVKSLSNLPFPKVSKMKLYHKILKGLFVVFYNLIVLLGIGGFILAIKEKKWLVILICSCVIPYIGLITFYYKSMEHRYFSTAYPFFVILAAYAGVLLLNYFRQNHNNSKLSA